MWKKFAIYQVGGEIERFWNAGLSIDGTKCFIIDIDEYVHLVFEVSSGKTLWIDESNSNRLNRSLLNDSDSHIHMTYGPVKGEYRLFGMGCNHPLLEHPHLNLRISLSIETEEVILSKKQVDEEVQRMKYEAFSGDWAFATFSDDGSTLAVLEPYYLTFFRYDTSS